MAVEMLGIDHERAPVPVRERFAFTRSAAAACCAALRSMDGIRGCVLLATCNRTELYWCGETAEDMRLWLCRYRGLDPGAYQDCMVRRSGEEAARHLFRLSCGLCSQILGEDQILTQIKEAQTLADECGVSNSLLNVLFRRAVTAGKRARTEIAFSHGDRSAAGAAISFLKAKGYELPGKSCLVIGNGEMGRLAATAMVREGAEVRVTVRQYHSGTVCIPEGCARTDYGCRYEYLGGCDYVISATASPNVTLTRSAVEAAYGGREQIYIDLAVPRDIDPAVGELAGVTLYGIDDLKLSASPELQLQQRQAEALAEAGLHDFTVWLAGKDVGPRLRTLSAAAGADAAWRTRRVYRQLPLDEPQRQLLEQTVTDAAEKAVAKLLYRLRDELDSDTLRSCLDALEQNGETLI